MLLTTLKSGRKKTSNGESNEGCRLTAEIHDSHIIALLPEGRFLIDTGSPQSFGDSASLELNGQLLSLSENGWAGTASRISDMVGTPLTGLIGTDLLGRFDLLLEPAEEAISLYDPGAAPLPETIMPMGSLLGSTPTVGLTLDGRHVTAAFDTGAKVSYSTQQHLEDAPETGSIDDFYPGHGNFNAPLHRCHIGIGGRLVDLDIGRLPEGLGSALLGGGMEMILGMDLLLSSNSEFEGVLFSPSRRLLGLLTKP
jgi:hypothetical protein